MILVEIKGSFLRQEGLETKAGLVLGVVITSTCRYLGKKEPTPFPWVRVAQD